MARYNKEFKSKIQQRMLPPNNEAVSQIAKETGVSEATLYKWRTQAKASGYVAPSNKKADQWSTKDKFAIVLETATLSEIELAKYCRSRGLFVEQVEAWRDACMQANGGVAEQASKLQKELREKERENQALSRELKRKEAALAETAALLVLRKKAQAIWGDPEDE